MNPQLYVRGSNRETVGLVESWSTLTLVQRRNDVGRWTVVLSNEADADLFQPGTGVLIRRQGQTLVSGWLETRAFTRSGATQQWTFGGWDDLIYFADTTCWPKPGSGITAQTDAYNVRTGPASDRIVGYWADNVVARLGIPGTGSGPVAGLGTIGTSRARFHTLLELAQAAAAKTLNFAVVQRDSDLVIVPTFTLPRNLTLAVQFSPDVGTVTGYSWTDTHPTATRIPVGGGDQLANRKFRLFTDTAAEAEWASVRKPERFTDRRDLDPLEATFESEMADEGAEQLLEGRRRSTFGMDVTDTEGLRYGINYQVGDKVRAYPTPGVPLDDLVEEVEVTWDAESGETAQVWVGPREDPQEADLRRERDIRRRITRIEKAT
jgi:hypothetical protein